MHVIQQNFKNLFNKLTQHNIINLLSGVLVILLLCCTLFLFPIKHAYLRFLVYVAISVLIARQFLLGIKLRKSLRLKYEVLPWLPFALSIGILTIIHDYDGYSIYVKCILLLTLCSFALQSYCIREKVIIFVLAASLALCSSSIIAYVLYYGIGTNILGINKNTLLCGMTLIFSTVLGALFSSFRSYSKEEGIALSICFILYLSALSLSEVRTGILGLIVLVLLGIVVTKQSVKIAFALLIPLMLLLISFIVSGRLQQGLHDLELWSSGTPSSSWGIRIELWKLAFNGFMEKPLSGWGYKPFDEIISSGIPWIVPSFRAAHFHSDFFNNLVSNGLIGSLGWLTTIVLLFKSIKNNSALLALLLTSRYGNL